MKKRTLAAAAVIWALVLVAVGSSTITMLLTGSTGAADSRSITEEEQAILDRYSRLEEVRGIISDNYYEEVDDETLVQGAIDGMLASIDDPYTFYYTVDDMQTYAESSTGIYKGVGMLVQINGDGGILIVRVFENSPADKAGILSGDVLTQINGEKLNVETAKDLNEAVDKIRGLPDTEVALSITRAGEQLEFNVTRGEVNINYVTYQMLDDIGYVRIYEFEETTSAMFKEALNYFTEQGAKGMIIDLRDNPGGLLDSVVEVADSILPKGRVVYTEDRAGNISSYYSSDDHSDMPLVLLVNENSASASEILTAAVQDYERGTVVGTKTYGKGIVQLVMMFDDGAGMQYTESRYFTPNGRQIHGIGVEPDVNVELDGEYDPAIREVSIENDNQLAAAVEELDKLTDK